MQFDKEEDNECKYDRMWLKNSNRNICKDNIFKAKTIGNHYSEFMITWVQSVKYCKCTTFDCVFYLSLFGGMQLPPLLEKTALQNK